MRTRPIWMIVAMETNTVESAASGKWERSQADGKVASMLKWSQKRRASLLCFFERDEWTRLRRKVRKDGGKKEEKGEKDNDEERRKKKNRKKKKIGKWCGGNKKVKEANTKTKKRKKIDGAPIYSPWKKKGRKYDWKIETNTKKIKTNFSLRHSPRKSIK